MKKSGNVMENIRTISDQDLMAKCQEFGKKAREWKNRFVALLPEVARRGLYRKKGFATIIEFAAKIGGVGKSTVEAVFRVDRILVDKPELKAMVAEVGVNKIRAVASIATKENEKELVKLVQKMSKPALEVFVREKRIENIEDVLNSNCEMFDYSDDEAIVKSRPGTDLTRERMSFSVDENIALEMRKIKLRMEKERKEAVEWNDVMAEMVKVMVIPKKKRWKKKNVVSANRSEKSGVGSDEADKVCEKVHKQAIRPGAGEKSVAEISQTPRYIIAEKRHDLDDEHNGKCGHSGCNKPATEIHHVEGFAQVRNHDKIIPLCHEHHEVAHHKMPTSPWLANRIVAMKL